MKAEDQDNIDDLLDYKFDKNDVDANMEEDSFNDDIMKYYEDHKKTSTNRASEVQNVQNRPISSYQRIVLSAKNKEEDEKPSPEMKIDQVSESELLHRLNMFIKEQKISQKEFCDNPNLYLDKNDFYDLFKKIKFHAKPEELYFLFQNRNTNFDEGYILVSVFFQNYPNLEWRETTIIEGNLTELVDYKKVNKEFKILYDDVLQIVQKECLRPVTSKTNNRIIKSAVINPTSKLMMGNSRPITSIPNQINLTTSNNLNKSSKVVMHKFFLETKKKKEAEEEMLRQQLEKRKREFEREFNKKFEEANAICDKLGIEDEIRDEYHRNKILSRVYVKESNNYDDDNDYKKFLIRKVKKYKEGHNESEKMWQLESKLDKPVSLSPDKNAIRGERKDIIKKYLIEAIRLKNKLKKQINLLREKPLIEESTILQNFRQMNIN